MNHEDFMQKAVELSLENIDILEFSQSKRALAALLLAKKIMKAY